MLRAPFDAETSFYPPDPPPGYKAKDAKTFKSSHKFSLHDNRDLLSNDGEVFGTSNQNRTIGRKLAADPERDLHRSEVDMLTHYGHQVTEYDYNTVYSDNYRGCQTSQPGVCCRKFPRQYLDPSSCPAPERVGCIVPPGAAPAADGRDPPPLPRCRAATELLAVTQQPFVAAAARGSAPSPWKYSYHGLPRCYPGGFSRIDPKTNPYPGFFVRRLTPTASSCDVNA
jgi:hypothetical protein